MKCVCGYEGGDFVGFYDAQKLARKPPANIKSDIMEPVGNLDPAYFAEVYACPKCGTLKVEAADDKKKS